MHRTLEFEIEPFKYAVSLLEDTLTIRATHKSEFLVWSNKITEKAPTNMKSTNVKFSPINIYEMFSDLANQKLSDKDNITINFPKTYDPYQDLIIEIRMKSAYIKTEPIIIVLSDEKISFEARMNQKFEKLTKDVENKFDKLAHKHELLERQFDELITDYKEKKKLINDLLVIAAMENENDQEEKFKELQDKLFETEFGEQIKLIMKRHAAKKAQRENNSSPAVPIYDTF